MSVESDLAEHLRLFIAQTNEKLAKSLSEGSRVHPATPKADHALKSPDDAQMRADVFKRGHAATDSKESLQHIPDTLADVRSRLERLEGQFKAVDERINALAAAVIGQLVKKL